ncbi:glycosyltransferase family 2 protein [Roseibaca sp. V10]|uniref:Glycosyltransferase family 2 protein n=1 Tax=Roseinatronobacter domitianus TaxID=2940293 RepID=A0ABT0M2K0_9RHOB|nr:glycosyltransferase family 2 protein [Roseibaca domitiana]MCL1628853.1 glycosyltransferase family 2 protein [Roseibaca domitiana]
MIPTPPSHSLTFRAPRRGSLVLEVDLRLDPNPMIGFWDESLSRMPLHIEFRRDARLMIINRYSLRGWSRELIRDLPHTVGPHRLGLQFKAGPTGPGTALDIWLDGHRLASLNALPHPARRGRYGLRRGFPNLDQISRIALPQAVRVMAQTGPERGARLTDRMEVTWTGPNPAHAVILPNDEMLTLEPVAGSEDIVGIVCAVLPGRVWHDHPQDLRLVNRDGSPHGHLPLSRPELTARLERLCRDGWVHLDALAALQALEHARAADVHDALSPDCLTALGQAAQAYRLGAFRPRQMMARPVPRKDPVAELRTRFDALPDGERNLASLAKLLQDASLSQTQMGHLLLGLSEWACTNADPVALFALAEQHEAVIPAPDTPYAASAGLPRLWALQDYDWLNHALTKMVPAQDKWIVTPALAWTIRALVEDRAGPRGHLSLWGREALLTAHLRMIRTLVADSGTQMRCPQLLDAVLDMIAKRDRLPDDIEPTLIRLVLESYGLVPEFWDRVRLLPAHLVPAAWPDWARMARELWTGAAGPNAAQIIAKFEQAYIVGTEAHRLSLLPEPGLPDPNSPAIGHLPAPQQQEIALRWLAFPRDNRPDPPPPDLHRLACEGVRVASSHTPRPAMGHAMRRLGTAAMAALRQLRADQPVKDLDSLRQQAATLLTPEAGYCGGAVLLAMAEALAHAGNTKTARHMLTTLAEGLASRDRADYSTTTALRHASARFAACCPDSDLRAFAAGILPPDPTLSGPATVLRAQANPLADTLVVLISCRPYLDNRVPKIRAAWGDLLEQAGVPMVVAVGGGTGPAKLVKGIVELPAPDDYEGLPQKILAIADWARTETGFSRILKIDDDCFLDPEAFFADLSALCVPYYGRPLRRTRGEMDRAWHMGKASSARGRNDLDKSPEPSVYADGSAAYLLGRDALRALNAARATPEGRALEAVSFMEDKLIGDLLALRGIHLSGENYDMAIFRHSAPGLPPLSNYENSFLPFAGSGLKVAHLDSGGDLQAARRALANPWPQPMKIWPPTVPVRLGWARNTLDLVSPSDRLAQARGAELAVIAVMRNEGFMLTHFLNHYRGLGVGAFLVADNGSDDGTLEMLVSQPDVTVFSTDTPYNESRYGVLWQEALLANFRQGRWSLVADADEFLFWSLPDPQRRVTGDLPGLLRGPAHHGADMVRLSMLDLYPPGPLSEARFALGPFTEATHIDRAPLRFDYAGRGPWGNCDSVTSNLRHRLMEAMGQPAARNLFVAQKYALMRYQPWMQFSAGLHYAVGGKVADRALAFAHFKYNSEFHAKAQAEVARGQHFNNAEEYGKYLALLSEGRDTLFAPDVSVPLAESPFLRDMVALR